MREKATSIAITAAVLLALAAPSSQAAQLVQECAPPGGTWGPGNTYRSKIQKYSDNTIVLMSQNAAQTDNTQWRRTSLPATGGTFPSAFGTPLTLEPEGAGYLLKSQGGSRGGGYNVHFVCSAAAAPR